MTCVPCCASLQGASEMACASLHRHTAARRHPTMSWHIVIHSRRKLILAISAFASAGMLVPHPPAGAWL